MKSVLPIAAALFAAVFATFGADSAVQAPPIGPLMPALRQGIAVTFTAAGVSDTRDGRLVALYVPADQCATPFLRPGPFAAKWEGEIASPLRAQYTFSADSLGSYVVSIDGASVLEGSGPVEGKPVQLKKGANHLVVEYKSPPAGDAMMRLYWKGSDFPAEPVQPASLSHNASDAALRTGERLREGRLLFAQLHCTACHDPAGLVPKGDASAMPELAQDAPVFAEFGARFQEAWLAHWINDPHSIRPHALMPRMFQSAPAGTIDPRAADIAAYLVSLGKPIDAPVAEDLAPKGAALFANLGCVACHTAPEPSGKDEFDRVPLAHLKAKWQATALREYLKNPQALYRWTRMPNFRLSDGEAAELTAFLMSGNQREFAAGPKGNAANGAQLAVSAGCLNCHAGIPPAAQPKLADTLKAGWTSGCMAVDEAKRGAAPDFALDAPQRSALLALAAAGFDSLQRDNPAEFLQRQFVNLRCAACHPRDGDSNIWSQLDSEVSALQAGAPLEVGEGKPAAGTSAPLFTWLGEKLKTDWAAKFIAGESPYKPRPWLIARMPGFGVYSAGLAQGLALDHGFPIEIPQEAAPDPALLKAGATLVSENGGFNCTTCHGLGERPPTAVFEAPAINFAYTHERIRHGCFHRWVNFPLRIDPETKMPRFADDSGKTALTDFFGGNASQQFEAIWQYIGTVKKPQ